jgi:hypothetical protein
MLCRCPSVQQCCWCAAAAPAAAVLVVVLLLLTLPLAPSEQFSAEGLHTRSSSAEYFRVSPDVNNTSRICMSIAGRQQQYLVLLLGAMVSPMHEVCVLTNISCMC